ncbi:MAG TPA: cytochrome P450 [Acidimicrobiia bacterium]|nr:cytochrome P450 [Acidimicrobiia bacterium]
MHLNPYSYAFHDDPFPMYRDLRDNAPCYYNDALDFWALSRYDDVLSALHDPQTYCSRFGITLEQQNALPMLLTTDPPDHTDLRRMVSRAFTPRRVADLESAVRELAQRYLEPVLEKGEGDIVADYAAQLPLDVIARMLGVPSADEESLGRWTNALLERDEGVPDVTPAGVDAAINLFKYFSEFVAERRDALADDDAPDDLTTALCTTGLTDEQVVGFCFLLIIAGNETTTKLLANCLLALQRFPGERAKVVSEPRRIPDAVEEILRYEGSTQLMARTLTRPVELHGERMPEGAKVLVLLGSANRDERVWDRPDEFDIDRASAVQHVGFGHGIHVCLGAALARLEMRVSLEEILRCMPEYEVDETACTRVHSGNVRGWATMPIRCHA